MCLVYVLKALGVGDTKLLAKVMEMATHMVCPVIGWAPTVTQWVSGCTQEGMLTAVSLVCEMVS